MHCPKSLSLCYKCWGCSIWLLSLARLSPSCSRRDKGLSTLCSHAHRHALAYVWKCVQYVWVYIWVYVCHAVICAFNCLFQSVLLWGFVVALQHMFPLWVCVSIYLCASPSVYMHLGAVRDQMCPYLGLWLHFVYLCLYVHVCVCVSEWMSTVRCCSMLCQLHLEPSVLGLSGRGVDDFNALEPQTDLSQTVGSMKPRQLGPVKLNRLIWVVSRRQTLWLHYNPQSDSLGNLWQSDTHKHLHLFQWYYNSALCCLGCRGYATDFFFFAFSVIQGYFLPSVCQEMCVQTHCACVYGLKIHRCNCL